MGEEILDQLFPFFASIFPPSLKRHLGKGIILYGSAKKTYSVLYLQLFTDFQHTKLRPFKRSASVIFLKFHKVEPQYSYKICSHRKKKECTLSGIGCGFRENYASL